MPNIEKSSAPEATIPNLSSATIEETTTMPKRSRLKQTLENNSKKTLTFSLGGIILLIVLLFFFGIPLLEKVAVLTSRNETSAEETDDGVIVVLPPDLRSDFSATNSAEINLAGTADEGDTVKLYKDGKLTGEAEVKDDASFVFKHVELKEGTNIFKAKTFKGDKESRLSEALTISYRKEAPKLSIDYPSEGQGISNKDGDRLQIEGSTNPESSVTINGSLTVVDDEGKFKYVMPIKGGENVIKAVSTDDAGNKTELERKFTYNP